MTDSGVWIAIVSLFVGLAGLLVGLLSLRHANMSLKGQGYLADLSKNQGKQIKIIKKQLERMNKAMPEKIILEREKLEQKKGEQDNKEKWKQYNAFIKTIKFLTNLNKK